MLQRTVSRRHLMKALLAAGGGAAAASFVPARWLKPVVRSGVLPVHAQTSAVTQGIAAWVEDRDGAPAAGYTVGIVTGGYYAARNRSRSKLAKPSLKRPVFDHVSTTNAGGFAGFSLDEGLYGVCCDEYGSCQDVRVLPGQVTTVYFPFDD